MCQKGWTTRVVLPLLSAIFWDGAGVWISVNKDYHLKGWMFVRIAGRFVTVSTENLSCRIRLMQQPGAQFLDNLFCSDGTMG
jgi:hypothetical protein